MFTQYVNFLISLTLLTTSSQQGTAMLQTTIIISALCLSSLTFGSQGSDTCSDSNYKEESKLNLNFSASDNRKNRRKKVKI